ncbi:MAG: thiamine diphosphokinase [Tissierellia bacterium]|nr:thiamine diphosphokinase [Tissierellia bacterium]
MKKALLLAGGNIADLELVSAYLDEMTDIICVDRGCDYALKNNLDIDLALGDFDSIDSNNYKSIEKKGLRKLTFNADKDFTDMELAIDYCLDNDYKKIYLFGALGTRMDHSMANIFFLYKYKDSFDDMVIIDQTNIIFLVKDRAIIQEKKGYNLSFIIASGSPKISLEGVKWPLKEFDMVLGDSLTISNKITDKEAFVQIQGGFVFCFLSKD